MSSGHNVVHCFVVIGRKQQEWLAEKVELRQPLPAAQCLRILRILARADALERFLAYRFPNSKVCFVLVHLVLPSAC